MIPADETFDGTWPHEPHFFEGNGFRRQHVDVNNPPTEFTEPKRAWSDTKRWADD